MQEIKYLNDKVIKKALAKEKKDIRNYIARMISDITNIPYEDLEDNLELVYPEVGYNSHLVIVKWITNITYIPCANTRCYLSVILDAFTKEVLSYVLSASLEIDFVLETINILVEKHGISLSTETLVHRDQGCHYTSYSFIQILKDKQLRQSMSRKGNCWDNAPQESFFSHMKDEIDLHQCKTFEDVKIIIDDWIDYYNNERYQWGLTKLSPVEIL